MSPYVSVGKGCRKTQAGACGKAGRSPLWYASRRVGALECICFLTKGGAMSEDTLGDMVPIERNVLGTGAIAPPTNLATFHPQ